MGTGILLIKMDIAYFTLVNMRVSAEKLLQYGYSHPSDDMYRACPRGSWTIPVDIDAETRVRNCSKVSKE